MGCEGYCEAGTPRGELALKIGVAAVVGGGMDRTSGRGCTWAARPPLSAFVRTPVCMRICIPLRGRFYLSFKSFYGPQKVMNYFCLGKPEY